MCNPVVVFACDDRYAMGLAVALKSMILNCRKYSRVRVWVMDGGIRALNKRKIEDTIKGSLAELTWLDRPSDPELKELLISGHITEQAYYRLWIPDLLPEDIGRAIYLDVDVVVAGDIGDLWDTDTEGKALLAVPVGDTRISDPGALPFYRELGIPAESRYFSSGVLVLNLRRWREENIRARILQILIRFKSRIRWHDQDGLNAVLWNDWGMLDASWFYRIESLEATSAAATREFLAGRIPGKAEIIHFAGSTKPWHAAATHAGKALFYRYLDRTEWAGWRPKAQVFDGISKIFRRTVLNKHFYGKQLRRLPVLGRLWTRYRGKSEESVP